ncbi:hypothetical protein R3W88_026611 [Solanum pinnatisectum]|uniref:TTF-type domain-containing protein n=1 Tax=Solanum pinnatisectum TaxID=50273 RepID=A0AAV9LDU6_9SOLN|nr:hypothetical protein R3W88_026611 [Solanum pinnatisectum]
MDKFLIKQPRSSSGPFVSSHVVPEAQRETITPSSSNVDCILGVGSLKRDPGGRKPIFEYDSNIRDVWFNAPNSAWLEYSIDDDAIFCLCCYLFKNEFESHGNARKSFTQDGFKTWNHGPERIRLHVGEFESVDSFANFSKSRIMKLAEYYKSEFGDNELRDLSYQLDSFIVYARDVERAFSSMKLIKNDLRNSIGEEFLNGCLVCKIERKIFENVSNDAIIDRFQNMKSRRVQL